MTSQNCVFLFFNDTATTEIYTLSLHDALPILLRSETATAAWSPLVPIQPTGVGIPFFCVAGGGGSVLYFYQLAHLRSEEHTSELQSRQYLVCRLLLEKKKK